MDLNFSFNFIKDLNLILTLNFVVCVIMNREKLDSEIASLDTEKYLKMFKNICYSLYDLHSSQMLLKRFFICHFSYEFLPQNIFVYKNRSYTL